MLAFVKQSFIKPSILPAINLSMIHIHPFMIHIPIHPSSIYPSINLYTHLVGHYCAITSPVSEAVVSKHTQTASLHQVALASLIKRLRATNEHSICLCVCGCAQHTSANLHVHTYVLFVCLVLCVCVSIKIQTRKCVVDSNNGAWMSVFILISKGGSHIHLQMVNGFNINYYYFGNLEPPLSEMSQLKCCRLLMYQQPHWWVLTNDGNVPF